MNYELGPLEFLNKTLNIYIYMLLLYYRKMNSESALQIIKYIIYSYLNIYFLNIKKTLKNVLEKAKK